MPPHPHRPPELEGQIFLGSDAVARGLLTEHQLRGQAWRRLAQNVYADARLDHTVELQSRAVLFRMQAGPVICGPTAAHLHGIEFAATLADPIHVTTSHAIRIPAQPGVRTHVAGDLHEMVDRDSDPPRTEPARAAWEVGAWLPPEQAVPILDAMLHRRLLDRADLDKILAARAGRRGHRRAQRAFAMTDADAQFQDESQLRIRLMLAGLPQPSLTTTVMLTATDLTVHPDMAWPQRRVCLEYRAGRTDVLRRAGWLVVDASPDRVRYDFPALQSDLVEALSQRGWRA